MGIGYTVGPLPAAAQLGLRLLVVVDILYVDVRQLLECISADLPCISRHEGLRPGDAEGGLL